MKTTTKCESKEQWLGARRIGALNRNENKGSIGLAPCTMAHDDGVQCRIIWLWSRHMAGIAEQTNTRRLAEPAEKIVARSEPIHEEICFERSPGSSGTTRETAKLASSRASSRAQLQGLKSAGCVPTFLNSNVGSMYLDDLLVQFDSFVV
ncbi:hypothetical protein V1477_011193 [Vespula maculifrons]|uniref:Uncharacterized protein n=1 Tax=Vespula maculifrons TaxID=7453 RepID=A0ABD2C477_VESMC